MTNLVCSQTALFRLSQYEVFPEWFGSFDLPATSSGLKRVAIGDFVYILDDTLDADDEPLIVISGELTSRVFDGVHDVGVLDRIITVARSAYSRSVTIPTRWRPHREGSLISITPSSTHHWRCRLHFDKRPRGCSDLLVFSLLDETINFGELTPPYHLQSEARSQLAEAILAPVEQVSDLGRAGIVLSRRLPQGFVQGATLNDWYETKLTSEQRSFVDKPHDGPVRLRGSAGTGKTLSLVIKYLRDALKAEAEGRQVRFGFVTHSSASVDLINAIAEGLDASGLLTGNAKHVQLEIRTLYEIAYDQLNFVLDDLQPLSLDGREGRKLQLELISDMIKDMRESAIVRLQYSKLSDTISGRWLTEDAEITKRFLREIMNEFSSVLDSEGIRAGEEKGERYVKTGGGRPAWLMALPGEMDRRFMLEIHRRYRKALTEMNTLSVDQMIGDFNSFLDSNRWSATKRRLGYDALFVDELHLFTSVERQTLHKLIKSATEEDGRPVRPPIFMAYDLKQSTKDTFYQFGEDGQIFTSTSQLQGSDLVKLNKVFRYTPEIAEFLADLDATFPAVDIPGEWEAYAGEAELSAGPPPKLLVHIDNKAVFQNTFKAAHETAKTTKGGGRRVAVLCASPEMFDVYMGALPQFDGQVLPITSREPTSELRHAGRRFIFSMPEYVAGLQFETVYLLHADVAEAPADAGDGALRRFISDLYLGASRAEQNLFLVSSMERGGPSAILDMARERRSLVPG